MKNRKFSIKALLSVCLTLCLVFGMFSMLSLSAFAAEENIFVNGDFEAGDDGSSYNNGVTSAHAKDGNYGWGFTGTSATSSTRIKDKCNVEANKTYVCTFDARMTTGATYSKANVTDNDSKRFTDAQSDVNVIADDTWHSYSIKFTPSASGKIRFFVWANTGAVISVDNIKVVEYVETTTPDPEPDTTGTNLLANGDFEAGRPGTSNDGDRTAAHAYNSSYGWGYTTTNTGTYIKIKTDLSLDASKTYVITFMAKSDNQGANFRACDKDSGIYKQVYLNKGNDWQPYELEFVPTKGTFRINVYATETYGVSGTVSIDNIVLKQKVEVTEPDPEEPTGDYTVQNGTVTTEAGHGDSESYKYDNASGDTAMYIWANNPVAADTTYTLTAYYKHSGENTPSISLYADTAVEAGVASELLLESTALEANCDWTKLEYKFKITGEALYPLIMIDAGSAEDTLYVDDISIAVEDTVVEDALLTFENLFTAGDFEEKDNFSGEVGGDISDASAKDGNYGFGFQSTNDWGAPAIKTGVDIVKGRSYTLNFDVRIVGSTASTPVYIYNQNPTEIGNYYYKGDGNWNKVSYTFEAKESGEASLYFYAPNGSTISVDNVELGLAVNANGFDGGILLGSDFDNEYKNFLYSNTAANNGKGKGYKGSNALECAAGTSGMWGAYVELTTKFNLATDKVYKLTFAAKKPAGANKANLMINEYEGTYGVRLQENYSLITANGGWNQYTVYFTMKNANKQACFLFYTADENYLWVDNIKLEEIPLYDGGLLKGSDFETGGAGVNFKTSSKSEITGEMAYGGKGTSLGHLNTSDATEEWKTVYINGYGHEELNLTAGKHYKVNFKAHNGSALNSYIQYGVASSESDYVGTGLTMKYGMMTLGEGWHDASFSFTPTTSGALMIHFGARDLAAGEYIAIDEVRIFEYTPHDGGLLTDGDFEGVVDRNFSNSNQEVTVLGGGADGSDKFLSHTAADQWAQINMGYKGLTVGKTYMLGFYAKHDMAQNLKPQVKILQTNDDTAYSYNATDVGGADASEMNYFDSNTEWVKCVTTFTARAKNVFVYFYPREGQTLSIDNLYLAEYTEDNTKAVITSPCPEKKIAKNDSANHIMDPGLEATTDVNNTIWNQAIQSDAFQIVTDDPANAHSGSGYLKVTGSASGQFATKVITFTGLSTNTDYTFSVWVRGNYRSATNNGDINFGLADSDGKFLQLTNDAVHNWGGKHEQGLSVDFTDTKSHVPPSFDNQWHLKAFTFNTHGKAKVDFYIRGSAEDVYFDDFTLCRTRDAVKYDGGVLTTNLSGSNRYSGQLGCAPENNLIENSWFDEGSEGWSDVPSYGSLVKIENGALKFASETGAGDAAKGKCFIRWVEVEKNTEYVFSAKLNITKANSNTFIALVPGTKGRIDKEGLYLNKTAFSRTGESELKWSFNSGNYTRVGIYMQDRGGEATLDNVRVFKTSDATINRGDLSQNDYKVDLRDLVAMKKALAGTASYNSDEVDVYIDGKNDGQDLTQMITYLLNGGAVWVEAQ